MVIVLGSVRIKDADRAQAMSLSLEHVRRSRTEPGCVSHGVSQDAEDPNRLVFVERWASLEALQAHFAVPASGAFVKALGALVTEPPSMHLFDAQRIDTRGQAAG